MALMTSSGFMDTFWPGIGQHNGYFGVGRSAFSRMLSRVASVKRSFERNDGVGGYYSGTIEPDEPPAVRGRAEGAAERAGEVQRRFAALDID